MAEEKKTNPDHSEDRASIIARLRAAKLSRTYLLLLLLIVGILFINIIKIFLVPLLLAAVFTALFYPLYERFLKVFDNKKALSSVLCCLVLLLGLLVPVYMVVHLVAQEAIDLYDTGEAKVRDIVSKGDEGLLGDLKRSPLLKRIDWDAIDWQTSLQDIAKNTGKIITTVINKTSRGTFQILTDLFITLFTMFYFFRDGQKLVERIKYLSPLDDIYEEGLMHRFVSVSRATIKGTLLIGVAQGTLGGITLWICGVGSPILWGLIMVVLSIIPLVGAWLVLYPAAIIQLITGNFWQGLVIFVVTVVVILNVDNVLRPRLVGRDAGMHDLMIFFSTLGGISVFGIMGFIIGPVIAVFFLTLLDIYSIEFKSSLDLARGASVGNYSSQPAESGETES
ncbi:AI-2E family transporter [bacterium]|nr:AI-2E family transporter [bacterium]